MDAPTARGCRRLVDLVLAGAAACGCHAGDRAEESYGPAIVVESSYPAPSEGSLCTVVDGPDCGVPRDVALQFRLSRFLDPATAVRQSLLLSTGNAYLSLLEPDYDAVERVLTYRSPEPLAPDTVYTVELRRPDENESGWGLRASDGAPLGEEAGGVPLRFHFKTRSAEPGGTAGADSSPANPSKASAPSCDEIEAVLVRGGCGNVTCHSGARPAMDLRLESVDDLVALGSLQTARGAQTGTRTDEPLRHPSRFGTQMPLIEPINPGNSYLLYKVLIGSENYGSSDGSAPATRYAAPLVDGIAPASVEIERVRNEFVRGEAMPGGSSRLNVEDLRLLQAFIATGARCP